MNVKERNEHETACPTCGADADWSFLDTAKKRIEVMCANCGRYEMSRERFDQAMAERSEVTEPDRYA